MVLSLDKKMTKVLLDLAKKMDNDKFKYLFIAKKNGKLYSIATDGPIALFVNNNNNNIPDDFKIKISLNIMNEIYDNDNYTGNIVMDIIDNKLIHQEKEYDYEIYAGYPDFFKLLPNERFQLSYNNYCEYQIGNKVMDTLLKINKKIGKHSNMVYYAYNHGKFSFITFTGNDNVFGICCNIENVGNPNIIYDKIENNA